MKPRRHATTTDTPATVPAVVNPTRADWSEWSAERERRRLAAEVEECRRIATEPIYPREIAQRIAADAAHQVIPDWRIVREDHRALYVKLLKAQPELHQREVRQMDNLLRLVGDQLPEAMRPLLADLRAILELRMQAHETAAFMIGIETGRQLERQYVDNTGRVRSRRKLSGTVTTENRLHLAGDK